MQVPKSVSYECQKYPCGGFEMFLFAASGKDIHSRVSVSRLEESKKEGYQRASNPTRVTKIAEYIDSGRIIPTSILISFDEGTFRDGMLHIPEGDDVGWVIDGQHRLAGAHIAEKDIIYPVVAFVGLKQKDQIEQFVTINREQRGVSSSLYIELLKMIGSKTTQDQLKERAAELADLVREDESSPFYGKIVSVRSPKPGEISITNWARKVVPLIDPKIGRLYRFNDDTRAQILSNYYIALAEVFPDQYDKVRSVFFRTVGFGALMNAFPVVFELTTAA